MQGVLPAPALTAARASGIGGVGALDWGTHFCQLYRTQQDLIETLVPFFEAGLHSNELCVWIAEDPLGVERAKALLGEAVSDLQERVERGQFRILAHEELRREPSRSHPTDVVGDWLRIEAEAREQGYAGLRINENLSWLRPHEWQEYSIHESSLHESLHRKHVLALCSYPLASFSPEQLLEVVRHHSFALVPSLQGWQAIRGADELLASQGRAPFSKDEPVSTVDKARPVGPHGVRFFEKGRYPSARIARFLQDGLDEGAGVVVFATPAHIDALSTELERLGTNVGERERAGQLTLKDAERAASTLLMDGALRVSRFEAVVVEEVHRVLTRFGSVRTYGEIVDVFAQASDFGAALEVERWWNELLANNDVRLLCGYEMASFASVESSGMFRHLCAEHDRIEPSLDRSQGDPGRTLAELAQARLALASESEGRARAEQERDRLSREERSARAQAGRTRGELDRLKRSIQALAEARSTAEVAAVTLAELADLLGPGHAVLAMRTDEAGKLLVFGESQPLRAAIEQQALLRDPLPSGADDALVMGFIPLSIAGQNLGILGFSIDRASDAFSSRRALLESYAEHVGLALERARSQDEARGARFRLQLLTDTSTRLVRAKLNLEQISAGITDAVISSGLADSCAIHLGQAQAPLIPLVSFRHADSEADARLRRPFDSAFVRVGRGILGGVALTGTPVRLSKPLETAGAYPTSSEVSTPSQRLTGLIVVPLWTFGKVAGLLTAARRARRGFTAEDERLLTDLADRAALFIENALLYQRAEQERKRAEDANRAKDEFLAILGHELRNPLSPILTAAHLMRLRGEDVLKRERNVIERQARHMVRLVDDLLDVSRITQGRVQLRMVPVELSQIVGAALEMASPILEERSHELFTEVAATGLMVRADPNRLAQVVANLLTNAAKYTEKCGKVWVCADRRGKTLALTVKDNGTGIEPLLLRKIFDPFVQGKQTRERALGGLGLGLAIAHNLVKLHGGHLRAESAGRGKGSVLTIELEALSEESAQHGERPASSQRTLRRRLRVLIVDDNVDAAETLAEVLGQSGHDVRVAHDGPAALKLAEEFRPELGLLDIGLPVMDGYELASRLHELFGNTGIKLLALTGYGHQSERRASNEAGFIDHLVKPVEPRHLEERILSLFEPS